MDIVGNDGYAWALASFFGFYVLIALSRTLFRLKQS